MFHQRGLAGAGRPHQCDQFTTGDRQRHTAQHRDVNLAQMIRLVDVFESNQFHDAPNFNTSSKPLHLLLAEHLRRERIGRFGVGNIIITAFANHDLHSLRHVFAAHFGH